MKTRDRILFTSLLLYNARGIASVSNGHIAEEMEISSGNLYYHFKNKLQIVEELVKNFETEITGLLNADSNLITTLEDLWFILHVAFELQEKYCFVLRDVDFLLEKYPELKKSIKRISAELARAAVQLCNSLRVSGAIELNDEEVESLSTNVMLIYTQWLNFRRFYSGGIDQGAIYQGNGAQSYIGQGVFQVLALFRAFVSQEAKTLLEQLGDNYRRA